MKNINRAYPFIIRIALLIAALSVQLICAIGLPYGSHGILLHALRCLEFAIALLLVYACYHVLKNHMYLFSPIKDLSRGMPAPTWINFKNS